ncbi:elongation factor-1alpha, putative, partial [Entamoeba invadens IP1]
MAYEEDPQLSRHEIEDLIDDVYSFLPEEIADTLTEDKVETFLEKANYDVKRAIAFIKKKYVPVKKTAVIEKTATSKTPVPSSKTPFKPKTPVPKTPSPLPSTPRNMPQVQHTEKRHRESFAGHVDSGKSTTVGHILQEVGVVAHSSLEKNKKECAVQGKKSFEYAWVMDTDDEERTR